MADYEKFIASYEKYIEGKPSELKPCPFCGKIPTLSKYKTGYTIDHVCTFIDPVWFPTKLYAIAAWNDRTVEE